MVSLESRPKHTFFTSFGRLKRYNSARLKSDNFSHLLFDFFVLKALHELEFPIKKTFALKNCRQKGVFLDSTKIIWNANFIKNRFIFKAKTPWRLKSSKVTMPISQLSIFWQHCLFPFSPSLSRVFRDQIDFFGASSSRLSMNAKKKIISRTVE